MQTFSVGSHFQNESGGNLLKSAPPHQARRVYHTPKMEFSSPPGFNDGFTDLNRPEGQMMMTQTPSGVRKFHWSTYERKWFPASVFLPIPRLPQVISQFTGRQLLEAPLPNLPSATIFGETHQSSQNNLLFATIGLLIPKMNPDGLMDYYSDQLQNVVAFLPHQIDPNIHLDYEADAINTPNTN